MKFNRALTLRILILKWCFNVCLLNVVVFFFVLLENYLLIMMSPLSLKGCKLDYARHSMDLFSRPNLYVILVAATFSLVLQDIRL